MLPNTKIRLMTVHPHCEPGGFLINQIVVFLQRNGHEVVFEGHGNWDVILLNTCVVKNFEISRTKLLIAEALKQPGLKKLIVFGCFHAFADKKNLDDRITIIGPKELEKFNDLFKPNIPIQSVSAGCLDDRIFSSDPSTSLISSQDYFLLIGHGCVQSCSYCNHTKAKGRVASRAIGNILADIETGVDQGKNDFALIADDCGSYGVDLNCDLAVLIGEIFRAYPDIRLKIASMFPGNLLRLFSRLRKSIAIGKIDVLTIPVQTGSTRLLKLMNRNYDLSRLKGIMKELRIIAPGLKLYTHFIVNFPTETHEDFMDSLRLSMLFDDYAIFDYSDNALTPASRIYPKIPSVEAEKRLRMFSEIKKRTKILTSDNRNA